MASFGLDLDGTITEDPLVFAAIVKLLRWAGHKVYIVTMRYPSEFVKEQDFWGPLVDGIVCTKRLAKQKTCEDLGIKIDIWIDDNPKAINADAYDIWGRVSEEGDVIVEDHGGEKIVSETKTRTLNNLNFLLDHSQIKQEALEQNYELKA